MKDFPVHRVLAWLTDPRQWHFHMMSGLSHVTGAGFLNPNTLCMMPNGKKSGGESKPALRSQPWLPVSRQEANGLAGAVVGSAGGQCGRWPQHVQP